MTEVAVIFVVNALTSFFKKYVYPTFGKVGVHALVFLGALAGAVYVTYGDQFMSAKAIILEAIGLFSLSVTLYEVLLQYFPLFKQDPGYTKYDYSDR